MIRNIIYLCLLGVFLNVFAMNTIASKYAMKNTQYDIKIITNNNYNIVYTENDVSELGTFESATAYREASLSGNDVVSKTYCKTKYARDTIDSGKTMIVVLRNSEGFLVFHTLSNCEQFDSIHQK